jgi:hypothetical protein
MASLGPSMGDTSTFCVVEYVYKPSGRATVNNVSSSFVATASHRLEERTIRPSKSCRAEGADNPVGFDPRGIGMSKQLTPAVDRGEDAMPELADALPLR